LHRPDRARRAVLFGLFCLVGGALLQILAARHPDQVEAIYARQVFPHVASVLQRLTASCPWSIGEGIVLLFLLYFAIRLGFGTLAILQRTSTVGAAFKSLTRVAVALVGPVYLLFLFTFGLNYQRNDVGKILGLDIQPPTIEEVESLAMDLVVQCNSLRPKLREDGEGVMRLARGRRESFSRAREGFRVASRRLPILAGPCSTPKPVLASSAMSFVGITGIYFPFTSEANVNVLYPEPEIPFVACHEMAHQLGFAREDEASYFGVVACRAHPDVEFQYSGALAALRHALGALSRSNPDAHQRLLQRLDAGVCRDFEAFRTFWKRYESFLFTVGSSVNDTYLKSQGEAQGVESYGRLIDLLVAERRAPVPPR